MKKIISLVCIICFFPFRVHGETVSEVNAKSMILTEASTGKVLAENNADEQLPIASVTKIMTLLLTMEAIENGKITMEDTVTVSKNAMSMGGSTMFLETGEELTVHELIKGIAVASANDGCVAMAEYLAGSEEVFVELMNKRAKELGMENTNFLNTNGLDEDGHYSSARDVAKMSCELIKHEKIFEYTTIWTGRMNNEQYELANTNKLIRFYNGANGLKTGSTDAAGCCLAATAKRDDMQLVAVVLGAPTSKDRFNAARSLLDYGFANYALYRPYEKEQIIDNARVLKGEKDFVGIKTAGDCSLLINKGQNNIETEIQISDNITAPINEGDKVGVVNFISDGKVIAQKSLCAAENVPKKGFIGWFVQILKQFTGAY